MDGWTITFVDTGQHATVGERLAAIRPLIGDDEMLLANYGDVLTDAPLGDMVERFAAGTAIASFLTVRPRPYTFHLIDLDGERVAAVQDVGTADLWINGGYFVLRREIFDHLRPGQDLVPHAFERMMAEDRLAAFPYEGFWAPMDTIKDRQILEARFESGDAPWAVWQRRDPVVKERRRCSG